VCGCAGSADPPTRGLHCAGPKLGLPSTSSLCFAVSASSSQRYLASPRCRILGRRPVNAVPLFRRELCSRSYPERCVGADVLVGGFIVLAQKQRGPIDQVIASYNVVEHRRIS